LRAVFYLLLDSVLLLGRLASFWRIYEHLYLNFSFVYLLSLSEIPDSITRLTNLQSLDLGNNRISEIPDLITRLTNLQSLDLRNNRISKIPDSITRLQKLTYLELVENPITEPPLEIVEEGIEAIRQYFKQIETEGIDYLYEAKLLIVGEGGAGKTSLANKIINPNYQLCEEDSTKGIEVLHWSFPRSDGNQFNVNIWDFGGQEIYHSTHQYFLTKRSLYLLVADTRKEDTDFYYWLNVIELLSDNSPILIVKNEKQDRQREINVNQLRGEFGSFKDVFATNLATNRDLEKILTEAQHQLSQLPHIGQTLPKTWVKVRHALENEPRNYISLNEYLQICKDNGFKERKDALQLSGYLHDLGICLHFQDDEMSPLYQIVILKPKWGTDAAYAVLDNPEVIRNFGRFSNKALALIWSANEYTGMHGGLLELMKRFQLCYEIPQEKGSYIAPQLLTENQPEYAWDESENLILRYTYDFMPKGIVRQFIVAIHENIEAQNVWRSGVIIHKREYPHTRAEVIENYGKREIKIRVSGKNKRDLLTVVTHELDKIHNSYKRLADKYQKLIPCNCNTCKGNQNPHFYPFATLQEFLSDRQLEIQCQKKPYNMVNVRNLLDDIGETEKNERQILRETEWQNSNNGKNIIEFKPQITVQPQITIQQQQQQGGTMDNQQQQQNNSDNSQQQQQTSRPLRAKSAWANGLFYLFLFVVVIGGIGYLAGTLKLLNLIAVIVAGIVFIPLVGALQLRQDDRLSEQNFMELVKLAIAQLPLIGNIFKGKN
jgi:small GTP-binding protein